MGRTIGVEQLGDEIRLRRERDELSLRDAELESGVSAATLSRIERGSIPDLSIAGRLAKWLEVDIQASGSLDSKSGSDEDLRRAIAVHLRANKNLSQKAAQSIADAFEIVMQVELEKLKRKR